MSVTDLLNVRVKDSDLPVDAITKLNADLGRRLPEGLTLPPVLVGIDSIYDLCAPGRITSLEIQISPVLLPYKADLPAYRETLESIRKFVGVCCQEVANYLNAYAQANLQGLHKIKHCEVKDTTGLLTFMRKNWDPTFDVVCTGSDEALFIVQAKFAPPIERMVSYKELGVMMFPDRNILRIDPTAAARNMAGDTLPKFLDAYKQQLESQIRAQ